MNNGTGSGCTSNRAWEGENSRDGYRAMQDFIRSENGWVSAKDLSTVSVGWAYYPKTKVYLIVCLGVADTGNGGGWG